MVSTANTPQTANKAGKPAKKRRISARVRKALMTRIEKGATWAECAQRGGIAESTLYKALTQPHVKQFIEEEKDKYCQRINMLEATHKARALEVARELLDDANSEAVKARMVEFLRGEAKQSAVNVQINNSLGAPQGYEFVPPNAQIVDITPAPEPEE